MAFSRISGIAALGFAFLIVLGNVITVPAGMPLTGADVGEVDAFFGAEGDAVAAGSVLTPAAWVLATLFGAGAVSALRRSERGCCRPRYCSPRPPSPPGSSTRPGRSAASVSSAG